MAAQSLSIDKYPKGELQVGEAAPPCWPAHILPLLIPPVHSTQSNDIINFTPFHPSIPSSGRFQLITIGQAVIDRHSPPVCLQPLESFLCIRHCGSVKYSVVHFIRDSPGRKHGSFSSREIFHPSPGMIFLFTCLSIWKSHGHIGGAGGGLSVSGVTWSHIPASALGLIHSQATPESGKPLDWWATVAL